MSWAVGPRSIRDLQIQAEGEEHTNSPSYPLQQQIHHKFTQIPTSNTINTQTHPATHFNNKFTTNSPSYPLQQQIHHKLTQLPTSTTNSPQTHPATHFNNNRHTNSPGHPPQQHYPSDTSCLGTLIVPIRAGGGVVVRGVTRQLI